jgi:hypothetical protein
MRKPDGTLGPGNSGRPKGARNKLAGYVFEDVLKFWNEPVAPGNPKTKGQAAMQMSFREKPSEFLRFVASLMPKEFVFEASMAELDDQGIDDLIEHIRARLLEERATAAADAADLQKTAVPLLTNESES